MSNNVTNILFAAGGTGGHLFPALAIADAIREKRPDTVFLFVGTKGKIEARAVPQRGYRFAPIWISGFHRGLRAENLLFPLKVLVSLVQSFFVIRRFRPHVVVGTGGYVCGPVLFVASLLRIPTVVHESNSYPGVTTRMLSSRATKVFTAFEATNKWLKRADNVERVGTPTRQELDNRSKDESIRFFGLDAGKKTVLVFGGSLGAHSMNRAMLGIVRHLAKAGIQFIWQTGEADSREIKENVQGMNVGWVGPFIDRMDFAYAAADIVVSRSGATTIAELTRIGKPVILVPLPFSAAGHQATNAKTVAEAGAAVIVADKDVDTKLEPSIRELLNNKATMDRMARASKSLGTPSAGPLIAEKILTLAAR